MGADPQDEGFVDAPAAGARRGGPAPPEAAPLAQRSRERIAQALAAQPEGLTAHGLAGVIGLHHNAVREHLAVLARAGVVSSSRDVASGRRGRPSIRHRLAAPDGLDAGGHRELVRLLMTLVRRAGMDPDEVERIGRDEGRLLGEPGGGAEEVVGVFARLGFAPEERTTRADELGSRDTTPDGAASPAPAATAPTATTPTPTTDGGRARLGRRSERRGRLRAEHPALTGRAR